MRALTAAVDGAARAHVHHGATSQDVMDTACSLVSRQAVGLIDEQLDDACRYARRLVDAYRDTPMVARTLGQQALPTTFGLRAAGWLDALMDARDELAAVPFAAQLGGAAGTMASLGDHGPRVLALLATGLDLDAPSLPWHTARGRIGRLGGALAVTAGTLEKIATDVVGLAQTEVGEVAEGGQGGGSSTLAPQAQPRGLGRRDRLCPPRAGRGVDPVRRDGAGARARRRCVAGRVAGGQRCAGGHRWRGGRGAGRRCASWRSVPTACGPTWT